MNRGLTIAEIGILPAVTDVVTAGRALGLGRTKAYELARTGQFPCPVIRAGTTYTLACGGKLLARLVHRRDLEGVPGPRRRRVGVQRQTLETGAEDPARRLPAVLSDPGISVGRCAPGHRRTVLRPDADLVVEGVPSRVRVSVVIALPPEQGVPVLDMRNKLTIFQGLDNPNRWQGPFRSSPNRWKTADGEAVVSALEAAKASPVSRPLGPLAQTRTQSEARHELADGDVIIPEDDELEVAAELQAAGTAHTEIQYLLLKLGAEMGFDVHVARNDQGKVWEGQRLGGLPRRREQIPQQFDPATNQTIELIDVLWLDGNAIVAAFEIESTSSIYSGLLRMSDLLAQQPNIAVPLFLVAPEQRRAKVIEQVNRPTFGRMKPPLVEVCRYISFEGLRESLTSVRDIVSYLKPDWLQKTSEACAPEDPSTQGRDKVPEVREPVPDGRDPDRV